MRRPPLHHAARGKGNNMKEIEPLINALIDLINSSKNLVVEQSPEIVRQWIKWGFWEDIGWVIFCAVLLVFVFPMLKWCRRNREEIFDGPGFMITHILIGVYAFFSFLGFLSNAIELVQISVAPKVWLIEHVISLAKSK